MKRTLATAGSAPVTTTEVKAQLAINFSDDDTLLAALIAAATDMAENITGRQLMTQTWDHWFDEFPEQILLPIAPIASVGSVKYYDGTNTQQTLSSSLYYADLHSYPAVIKPVTTWPATYDKPNAVTVRITAGYASADLIPAGIKQGILMLIGHLYENREATAPITITEVPMSARFLLEQWAVR